MPEIFDNLTEHLGPALRRTLEGSTGVDACVGYFNFRGWNEIAEAVGNLRFEPGAKPAMRLLIGMNTGDHDALQTALHEGEFSATHSGPILSVWSPNTKCAGFRYLSNSDRRRNVDMAQTIASLTERALHPAGDSKISGFAAPGPKPSPFPGCATCWKL